MLNYALSSLNFSPRRLMIQENLIKAFDIHKVLHYILLNRRREGSRQGPDRKESQEYDVTGAIVPAF